MKNILALVCVLMFSVLVYYIQRKCAKSFKHFSSSKECLAYFNVVVPEGYVAFHKDRDRTNNTFNNLEIITRTEMLNRIRKSK